MKLRTKTAVLLRVVSVVAALALSVGMFAGCGKKATDKDEQGRTIIRVGGWPAVEGASLDVMNAKKAAFEESNPDVVIEPDEWAFDRKTFYAKAAGGQLPTVFYTGVTEMPEIIYSEYSADLTEVLKERGYGGKFNDTILDIISDEEGNIMAFPAFAYFLGLAFNVDLMEAAGLMQKDGTPMQPKTWDEVVEFAIKIKEATGVPGFIFPTGNKSGGWLFTSLAWSFGVDFMEKDENGKWQATFDTPEAAEALQFIKDLKWKHNILPEDTLIDGTRYYELFATGQAGMLITAGNMPTSFAQYGMKPEQIGMMAMPAGPKRHVTLLGGDVRCINSQATKDQIDASIRWLEQDYNYNLTDTFKETKEMNLKTQVSEGKIVGIKSVPVWDEDVEVVKYENALIDQYTNTNPNYVRLYNEFLMNPYPCEVQPEEPVCCQELYAELDACLQAVLEHEDADPATLMKNANDNFQKDYLDELNY